MAVSSSGPNKAIHMEALESVLTSNFITLLLTE